MKQNVIVCIVAVVCITFLEGIALFKGVNGALLSTGIGVIGTIVGYLFGRTAREKKHE